MPPHPADPVDRYLRHCLAARWEPGALDQARALRDAGALDPAALRDALRAGGVGPLIYAVARGRDVLPPALEDELKLAYYQVARSNLLRFQELGRVLRALEAAGIPALVLKGAALAEAIYENPGVRPMCDLDVLVQEGDVPPALHVLRNLGYQIIPPLTYRCEVMLKKAGDPPQILELHWNLFVVPYYLTRLPLSWFWETAIPATLGGAPGLILGPEAQVLHLCGHLSLHHPSEETARLLWLYDVAALLRAFEDRIDWPLLIDQARRCDLILAVKATLLSGILPRWPGLLPEPVVEHLRTASPTPNEAQIVRQLREGYGSRARRLLHELAQLPAGRARRRFLWRNLFPPLPYMQQIYEVQRRWLVPLYYPYRWWLGLRKLVFRRH